jgi:hypothetical protein
MTLFYCPYCWKLIPDDALVCAFCQNSLTDWHDPKVIDSLLTALRSAETTRARFAAQMLARQSATQAIARFPEPGRATEDPGITEAVNISAGDGREGELSE